MLPPKPAFMKFTTTPVVRAMTFTKQVFQDIVLPINWYINHMLNSGNVRYSRKFGVPHDRGNNIGQSRN